MPLVSGDIVQIIAMLDGERRRLARHLTLLRAPAIAPALHRLVSRRALSAVIWEFGSQRGEYVTVNLTYPAGAKAELVDALKV